MLSVSMTYSVTGVLHSLAKFDHRESKCRANIRALACSSFVADAWLCTCFALLIYAVVSLCRLQPDNRRSSKLSNRPKTLFRRGGIHLLVLVSQGQSNNSKAASTSKHLMDSKMAQ